MEFHSLLTTRLAVEVRTVNDSWSIIYAASFVGYLIRPIEYGADIVGEIVIPNITQLDSTLISFMICSPQRNEVDRRSRPDDCRRRY